MSSSDKQIFGTSITIGYVEQRLQESLQTTSKFGADPKIVLIGVGEGFMSVIARIYPQWIPANPKLPESIVAKIPNLSAASVFTKNSQFGSMMEECGVKAESFANVVNNLTLPAHNAEVSFYEMIKNNGIEASVPKLYFGERFSDTCKLGLLLLEDLGTDTAISKLYENISIEEAKQVLKSLAVVHAFSLSHPEVLNITEVKLAAVLNELNGNGVGMAMVLSTHNNDDELKPLFNEMLKYNDILTNATILDEVGGQCGLPKTLAHGDLWTSNVMWKKKGNEGRELAGIIDWQAVHSGTPAEDIIRYFSCALSTEDRRQHFDDLLMYYYNELQYSYGKKLPFQYENLKASCEKLYPHVATYALPFFGAFGAPNFCGQNQKEIQGLMLSLKEKCKGLVEDVVKSLKKNYSSIN